MQRLSKKSALLRFITSFLNYLQMAKIRLFVTSWRAKADTLEPAKAAQMRSLVAGFLQAYNTLAGENASDEDLNDLIRIAEETMKRAMPKPKPKVSPYRFVGVQKRIDAESKLWDLLGSSQTAIVGKKPYKLLEFGGKQYAIISIAHNPQGQAVSAVVRHIARLLNS